MNIDRINNQMTFLIESVTLNEDYKDIMTPEEVLKYINQHHSKGWEKKQYEDWEWISQYNTWKLEDVPVETLKIAAKHPPVASKYAKFGDSEFPPIVVDSESRYILDGNHRASAAKIRGNKTIKAYVGYNETPEIMNESMNVVKSLIIEELTVVSYSNWKRKNVTYRGVSNSEGSPDDINGNSGAAMLGTGLYSTKDKSFAKKYGKRYALVGAIPSNPKTFNTLNDWEIWFQNYLVFPISKEKGKYYPDSRDFFMLTTIEKELQKMGYDGIIIKGREMVHFNPKDVIYFENERQLKQYYESNLDTLKYIYEHINENLKNNRKSNI